MVSFLLNLLRYQPLRIFLPAHLLFFPSVQNEAPKIRLLTGISILLHLAGLIGIGIFNSPFFSNLTLLHMLIVFAFFLFAFWQQRLNFLSWSVIAYFLSFTAEWIGVHTGLIFGDYSYEPGLGTTFLNVPVLIGIAWITITCGAVNLAKLFTSNFWLINLITSFLAVLFDCFLEPVAERLNYWKWQKGEIPLLNYVSWAFLSFILSALWQLFKIKSETFAKNYFLIQTVFFLLVALMLN